MGDGPHRQQLEKHFEGTATTFVGYLAGEELASAYASGAPGERCDVALFAHGHILRSLAGCWLGQGPAGGARLVLGTGSFCVLGYERQTRALIHWNAPAQMAESQNPCHLEDTRPSQRGVDDAG